MCGSDPKPAKFRFVKEVNAYKIHNICLIQIMKLDVSKSAGTELTSIILISDSATTEKKNQGKPGDVKFLKHFWAFLIAVRQNKWLIYPETNLDA